MQGVYPVEGFRHRRYVTNDYELLIPQHQFQGSRLRSEEVSRQYFGRRGYKSTSPVCWTLSKSARQLQSDIAWNWLLIYLSPLKIPTNHWGDVFNFIGSMTLWKWKTNDLGRNDRSLISWKRIYLNESFVDTWLRVARLFVVNTNLDSALMHKINEVLSSAGIR